jgi:uncharacterized membrane protein HdeD (DUF308 family)
MFDNTKEIAILIFFATASIINLILAERSRQENNKFWRCLHEILSYICFILISLRLFFL